MIQSGQPAGLAVDHVLAEVGAGEAAHIGKAVAPIARLRPAAIQHRTQGGAQGQPHPGEDQPPPPGALPLPAGAEEISGGIGQKDGHKGQDQPQRAEGKGQPQQLPHRRAVHTALSQDHQHREAEGQEQQGDAVDPGSPPPVHPSTKGEIYQPGQKRDCDQTGPRGAPEEQGQRTQKRRPQRNQTIARQNVENPAHIITTFVFFVIISQPKGACPPGKTVFVPEKPPLFLVKPGIFGYNGLRIQTTKPKGDLYVQV